MKRKVKNLINNALKKAYKNGDLLSSDFPETEVEEPKIGSQGDLSTNIAMKMAKIQKMAPRKIAEAILSNVENPDNIVAKMEIAGPGFINFFINALAWHPFLKKIHDEDTGYGASNIGQGRRIQIEFVSANPTGPLHVGHGRGAAVGDAVANILAYCGYDVQREYYVNDSGRQIRTLGLSVFLRYRELFDQNIIFPDDCYQGEYIKDLAETIKAENGRKLLEKDEEQAVEFCARFAASTILKGIETDLADFGISFDRWYNEQSLFDSGRVDTIIRELKDKGIIYEKDGANWFRTTDYGDEKDRVVVRENGLTTYFASDIAYHKEKFERGFTRVIDVWGADHHGYIPRIAASVQAAGYDKNQFNVILIQLVNLLRGGKPASMSTRSGEFVTLKNVVDEVGRDAARFIFLTRHYESPLDFDLELARKQTNENPVYYVQYVHARISSILKKGKKEKGITHVSWNEKALSGLTEPEEIQIIRQLIGYPETVRASAELMEPHRITYYLMNLASSFHSYYNKHKVLTDDPDLTEARLYLVLAVKKIIRNGLTLLGVSAPDKV
ncbi:MAG: arginine--tRNA ligase [Deltaproteobacteria bacterium]|nr:arginine--tRNA ligase [Deltaproteobacteria bacterium]